MPDALKDEMDEIEQTATDLSITIVPAAFENEKLPTIDWDTSSPSAWKPYLAMARKLDCVLVVLQQYGFDQETLEELRPEGSEGEYDEELEDEEQTERAKELAAKWEKIVQEHFGYYGSSYAFALYYFNDGICHRYEKEAEWYTKLTQAANSLREELEAAEADLEEEEIPELSDDEIERIAADLAKSDLFQQAGNQNARRFALKKKFPKIIEEHHRQITEIIDQAKGIFELEIKPEMEKALDNQIVELSKQGLNKDEIAKKVKVPVARVKKAL